MHQSDREALSSFAHMVAAATTAFSVELGPCDGAESMGSWQTPYTNRAPSEAYAPSRSARWGGSFLACWLTLLLKATFHELRASSHPLCLLRHTRDQHPGFAKRHVLCEQAMR